MFGGYVVKHYFCIRIRERTALQNMMKKTFRKNFLKYLEVWNKSSYLCIHVR